MVLNIGIYNSNEAISGNIYYTKWKSMLVRCYDTNYHKRQPSYIGVTVCPEWLTYSNFKSWMVEQEFKGLQLDKDLLGLDSRIYSPDTCCFIPSILNTLIQKTLPPKANYGGKYRVQIKINSKTTHVGIYNTLSEAQVAYNIAKASKLLEFINTGLPDHIETAIYLYQERMLGGVL